jgi:hypothetical protein
MTVVHRDLPFRTAEDEGRCGMASWQLAAGHCKGMADRMKVPNASDEFGRCRLRPLPMCQLRFSCTFIKRDGSAFAERVNRPLSNVRASSVDRITRMNNEDSRTRTPLKYSAEINTRAAW